MLRNCLLEPRPPFQHRHVGSCPKKKGFRWPRGHLGQNQQPLWESELVMWATEEEEGHAFLAFTGFIGACFIASGRNQISTHLTLLFFCCCFLGCVCVCFNNEIYWLMKLEILKICVCPQAELGPGVQLTLIMLCVSFPLSDFLLSVGFTPQQIFCLWLVVDSTLYSQQLMFWVKEELYLLLPYIN